MSLTKFEILDRAVAAGEVSLSATQLGGSTSSAKKLREELCAVKHLATSGKKYSLTPSGKAAWLQEAPPERVAAEQQREKEQATKLLVDFVTGVQNKNGKGCKNVGPEVRPDEQARR